MDPHLADQHPLQVSCPARESHEHNAGTVQQTDEQAPSRPYPHAQTGVADTGCIDIHETPSDQAENHLPDQSHAHESDGSFSESMSTFPEQPEDVPSGDNTSQTTSNTQSAHPQLNQTNVSTSMVPAHQTSSAPSGLTLSNAELQHPPALRLSESLGLEGCVGILGGFFGLLGVFGFLNFIWFGYGPAPEATKAMWVWRQLAIHNWMPQAVTLASLILRLIVGIQAAICTSMIAALLLERLSIPRLQVAHASVMRGINDGPWKLVMLVLSSKGNALYFLRHLESWLIISLAFSSFALQFTSTILLSDMRTFRMIGDLNITTFNGLFAYPGKEKFQLYQGPLMTSAPVYPIFGETFTMHDSTPDSRGLSDTGLTQRGLLPMANRDHRTSIREYDGMGMVMSSRVACMRPVITNASLDFASERHDFRQLQGVLHYSQSLREAKPGTGPLCSISENCEKLSFECTMPAAEEGAWAPGACILDGVGGHFRGSNQSLWDPADVPWSENSSIWLVYSTSMTIDLWRPIPPSFSMQSAQLSADNEWIMYEIVPDHFIKVAVCFSDFDFAYRDIRMRAAEATTEPSTNVSMVTAENFGLEKVQTYLGLDRSRRSATDKGILSLEVKPDNSTPNTRPPSHYDILNQPTDKITPGALTASSIRLELGYELCDGNHKNTSFSLCVYCYMDALIAPHLEYGLLFSGMILGTPLAGGRAADALHAFISVAGINVYNQFLATSMNVAQQARVVTTRNVIVPGSWPPSTAACGGLIAVASLLAAYLFSVAVITVLYIRHTRYSRYGNVWHVISQLVDSEELGETLKFGNNASDKAVKVGLQTKGLFKEDVLVKLGKTDGCENIKVKRS